ncbi:MAG: AbrB/MazE/SpoVT family DNA-binding domain-containing protein [Nitrososphaerales archaeon]
MGLKSKVGLAKTGTNSLRTTIPEGIVEYLNLKAGDILEWSMEIIGNSERVTLVKKVRE